MFKETPVKIKFDANVQMEQSIVITNGDDKDTLVERLRSGRYLTTLSFDTKDPTSSQVIDTYTMLEVGVVVLSENIDEHEPYTEFNLSED